MSTEQERLWSDGEQYENYTGHLSRRVAPHFLDWTGYPGQGLTWCDLCCGTGALTSTILERCAPCSIDAVDASDAYLMFAKRRISDSRVRFHRSDVEELSLSAESYDLVVSGLALNFLNNPPAAAAHLVRILKPRGIAAAYIWDFIDGMRMIREFWDAVMILDPASAGYDPANRFPLCKLDSFKKLFETAGLQNVESTAIEIQAHFSDFERYWSSFLTGQGTAPLYAVSLSEERRERLRAILEERLEKNGDGSISLAVRAWAVKGIKL